MASSACFKVLGTTELLENVIEHLPFVDKYRVQRTCRQFRDTVKGSVKLQQQMFLRPCPDVKHTTTSADPEINPLLRDLPTFPPPLNVFQLHSLIKLPLTKDRGTPIHMNFANYSTTPAFLMAIFSDHSVADILASLPSSFLDQLITCSGSEVKLSLRWIHSPNGATPPRNRIGYDRWRVEVKVKPATPRAWLEIMCSMVDLAPDYSGHDLYGRNWSLIKGCTSKEDFPEKLKKLLCDDPMHELTCYRWRDA